MVKIDEKSWDKINHSNGASSINYENNGDDSSLDSHYWCKMCSDDDTVNSDRTTRNVKAERTIKQILSLLDTNEYDSSSEDSSTMSPDGSNDESLMSNEKRKDSGDDNSVDEDNDNGNHNVKIENIETVQELEIGLKGVMIKQVVPS